MLPLIDILTILSGVSAAQAGPIRRYVNTTSQAPQAVTGVAYHPYAGSPSLSLAPIQGVTTLPFSELAAETQAEAPAASSGTILALSDTSTAAVTGAASFEYQPKSAESTGNDGTTSMPCKSRMSGAPTSFWTFGDQNAGTVTMTSTTYITVSVPSPVVESSSPPDSAVQNTTATSAVQISLTLSFDPLPTATDPSTTELEATTTVSETSATASPTESSTQDSSSASSTFAYPYPDSDPATTATDPQSDATKTAIESSSTYYSDLPVVVTEGTPPETQSQQSVASTTDSTAIPGITIIPQNPSVIYITVTDAGATTTVTA